MAGYKEDIESHILLAEGNDEVLYREDLMEELKTEVKDYYVEENSMRVQRL